MKFLCGTQDSKSRRLILTGPTSGHLTEVINYQGPAHTNWLSLHWAAWPGASPHAPSAHCLRGSTWAQAWAPSYGFSYVIGVPAPSPLLLSGFSGLTLGLICLPCLMITGPSGEPVAITPLLCSACSGPVGLCPGHKGPCCYHPWFLACFPSYSSPVPVAPWSCFGESSTFRHLFSHCWERQAHTEAVLFSGGFEWYSAVPLFLLSLQRSPRKSGPSR